MQPSDKPVQTLTARWVLPLDGPPLEGGTITVREDRIEAVEPRGRRPADVDCGNAAILPGLVNAHTHLDLSGLRGRCPPSPDFTVWLRQVIAHRRATTPEQTQLDIRAGLEEALRSGTTLVGDITSGGASWPLLVSSPLRAVVFHEVLGLPQERAAAALASAREWLSAHPPTPTCRPGLSPHAPYSVHQELFRQAGQLCGERSGPLAVHLAETMAELELMERRCGPFVNFLEQLGVWEPTGIVSNPQEVVQLCREAPRLLLVHANFLPASSSILPHATVVYCPRTHAAFGHPAHPFPELLANGVRVALGTDSLASNPDLDLLAEARFLHQHHPRVPGRTVLHMATLAGAEALGWADETGSLTPGKSADLVVVPLSNLDHVEPHAQVLQSPASVSAVMVRGHWWVGPPGAVAS